MSPLISRGYGPLQDAYQASEVGVNLQSGYNGHLTSREAGSVGGQMVKNRTPERSKIFARECRIATDYCYSVRYIFRLVP